jgi:thiol peroxidase
MSDYKNREFGTKTGFLIDELKLLARGYILIERNKKVHTVKILDEVTNQIDVKEIRHLLDNHAKTH